MNTPHSKKHLKDLFSSFKSDNGPDNVWTFGNWGVFCLGMKRFQLACYRTCVGNMHR